MSLCLCQNSIVYLLGRFGREKEVHIHVSSAVYTHAVPTAGVCVFVCVL